MVKFTKVPDTFYGRPPSSIFSRTEGVDTHHYLIIINAHVLIVEERVHKCIEISLEGVSSLGYPSRTRLTLFSDRRGI